MPLLWGFGVMSLLWMAIVAAVIFAEKALPLGDRLTNMIAVPPSGSALVALRPAACRA